MKNLRRICLFGYIFGVISSSNTIIYSNDNALDLSETILSSQDKDPIQNAEKASQAPLIVLVLMVKNEELVINKTLDPYIQAGIDSYLIFDTGSTDKTIETVKEHFEKNKIKNVHIYQEPFIDFATSRNHALELAEQAFPRANFFLMPDAEWYMHNVEGLIEFCKKQANDQCNCYLVRIVNQRLDFTQARLIRAKTNARFAGRVHETIISSSYKRVPIDIFFELGVSRGGMEKSKQRWERDLKILLGVYEENPSDPRNTFYLAQTYECLCDFVNAYKFYEIRSKQNGWIEENYETFYRLGRIIDILSMTDKNYSWNMAQDYYFMAHKILPHRAEPLVKISQHYWPDASTPENIALCYLFAKRAYELPYPENDLLFVDPEVYNFLRYELLSKSAWHMKDFELGEIATRKALKFKEMSYLLRNLACYLEAQRK